MKVATNVQVKSRQSAQYCRICNVTHDADGVCGQHDLQYRKALHGVKKRMGTLKDRKQ